MAKAPLPPETQKLNHSYELSREIPHTNRRIQAASARALCGDISDMTLWRWINERDFPKPAYIGRRRYWRESDVLDWLEAQPVLRGSV